MGLVQRPKWVSPTAFVLTFVIGSVVADQLDRHQVASPHTAWIWALVTVLPGVVVFLCLRDLIGRAAVGFRPS